MMVIIAFDLPVGRVAAAVINLPSCLRLRFSHIAPVLCRHFQDGDTRSPVVTIDDAVQLRGRLTSHVIMCCCLRWRFIWLRELMLAAGATHNASLTSPLKVLESECDDLARGVLDAVD